MTNRIITFKTGRLYTEHGQRIIAMRLDDGGYAFVDVDRGIEGVIPYAKVTELSLTFDKDSIMRVYDAAGDLCHYWAHTHDHHDLLVVLTELAKARMP